MRRVWFKLKDTVFHEEDSPVLVSDRLADVTLDLLDKVAGPPACGPLIDDLDATLVPGFWRRSAHHG